MGIQRLVTRIDRVEGEGGEQLLERLRREREARRQRPGSGPGSRAAFIEKLEKQLEKEGEEEDPRTPEEIAENDSAFQDAMDELFLMRRRHALSALMEMADPEKALRWAVLSGLDEPLPERLQDKLDEEG